MSLDELSGDWRAQLRRRIDCPVPWCDGRWLQHGGDGAAPDDWVHDEEYATTLPHGAHLSRSQVGAGPIEWSLAIEGDGGSVFSLAPMSPGDYAELLEQIAAALRVGGMS